MWVYKPTCLSGVSSAGLTLSSQSFYPLIRQCLQPHLTTLQSVYHYRYQHGRTSYFSSCRHSGCGPSTGFLQYVSTVKVLSIAVTLQLTDLWYQRRSELDVDNQFQQRLPHWPPGLRFRFGFACAPHNNNLQFRGFVDEDLFVRDLDAFDYLEARGRHGAAKSVYFIYS
jgi:hypothetical protein